MLQISMFSSEEPPARVSQSPASEAAWMTSVATSCLSLARLLGDIAPLGYVGRMSPASFQATEDETLQAFWDYSADGGSKSPQEDGKTREMSKGTRAHTASHGACLTLNMSEWTAIPAQFPNDDGVCSLSDILETGAVPQRYYLSARACRGILRRAEKRGKSLPPSLAAALEAVASEPTLTATED